MEDFFYVNVEKLANSNLSPTENAVMIFFLSIVDSEAMVYETVSSTAKAIDKSRQATSNAFKGLEGRGMIERNGIGRIKVSSDIVRFEEEM